MEDEMYSGKAKPEEALEYTKEMFNSWLEDSGMTESEKPVSDYSERREREKDYTSAKSDKPKKSHTSDSYEESDYMKRRKKEMYEVNEGMGDEKWITPDEVESDYSFYSDMYKGVYGVRPHGQSAEQLCNWLNSEFKLEGNRIVRKDGQDELYEVNEGMGDEKWASDGGYYTKPDTSITVSKETADFINQTIEEFKRDIQDESDSIMVDKTEKGQINLKIIRDLQKNWNISFEYDTEGGGQSFYWLSPNQSMEDLNDGLENAWQLFYDRVQK